MMALSSLLESIPDLHLAHQFRLDPQGLDFLIDPTVTLRTHLDIEMPKHLC